MNFLAHLHLSGNHPGWLLGAILGDFTRGRLTPDRFPNPILKGVVLHRRVDAFTDSHPVWKSSKSLLAPHRRRFAGIIVDVIYDHFLGKHWSTFSDDNFDVWVAATYTALRGEWSKLNRQSEEPTQTFAEAGEMIDRLVRDDWLHAYLDRSEIPRVLERITHRSPSLSKMRGSGEEFSLHYGEFESHFLAFYPELIEEAERFRERRNS